jgi:hypothetical protein
MSFELIAPLHQHRICTFFSVNEYIDTQAISLESRQSCRLGRQAAQKIFAAAKFKPGRYK